MVRLRREKGGPTKAQPSAASQKEVKGKRKGQGKVSISMDAVLALGGDEADMDLLRGVDESTVSGQQNHDPTLRKDVSKFLKGLHLKDGGPPHLKTKGKGKEKALFEQQLPSTKKSTSTSEADKPTKLPKERSRTKTKTSSTTNAASDPSGESSTPADDHDQPKANAKLPSPTKAPTTPKSHFVFAPTPQWHAALPPLPSSPPAPTPTPTQLAALASKAAQLHASDTHAFLTASASTASEASFMAKIIQSGTLSDRLSALTLLVQRSPVHNTRALEGLRGLAERGKGKGGREESLKALRCVVDWWVGGGVPGRKLRYFRDQPLLHPGVTDAYLVAWYFEDWLKKFFFSILQILETLSLDPLPYVRTQSLSLIFTLLRDSPEQEQNLLRLLVNKLGDTDKALCARASWHLLQLLQRHPDMKRVVVGEVAGMVLRPAAAGTSAANTAGAPGGGAKGTHIRFSEVEKKAKTKERKQEKERRPGNAHARYYAAVTFNQIVLAPSDREVALRLLDVYFEMFREVLGEGEGADADADHIGADGEVDKEVKTDKKGRVRDGSKAKGKGRKAGEKKGAAGFTELEDENSRLVSAILTGVNRALPFAKVDAGDAGINKHIDTLFLITHKSTFNISLQALMLIQQITASLLSSSSSTSTTTTTAKSIIDRYYRTLYASLHDTRLATSSKQAMYLNLFFKSVKADVGHTGDNERVKALVRRFVQVLVSGGGGATEFVAGGLYLLGELFSTIPGLRQMVTRAPPPPKDGEEREYEHEYDPRKREPQFAHAGASPLWELTPLLHHHHPAISLHARQLLSSALLTASADLSQNTLSHFLDRFVYKNPKKLKAAKNADEDDANTSVIPGAKGASVMQPAASALEGVKLVKGELAGGFGGGLGMNEKAFVRRKRAEVPVDQLFFHDYFTRKQERERAMTKKRKEGVAEDEEEEQGGEEDDDEEEKEGEAVKLAGSDWDEEADNDLEEEEIWKAMKASMPTAGDDEDDLMDDSDSEDDDDEVPDFGDDSDLAIEDDLEEEDDEDDGDAEEKEKEDSDDDDVMSLIEGSDNEDLISLDGDVPEGLGLIEYDGSDDSDSDDGGGDPGVLLPDADVDLGEEEWHGIGTTKNDKKRKHDEATAGGKGGKRKKLRSLPTFASYEDYAKLIEEGPEDDI